MVRLLVDSPAGAGVVNPRDDGGWTPLRHLLPRVPPSVVSMLLEHGADLHLRDSWGATALHVAPGAEAVRVLLAAGDCVHVVDGEGQTPLHTAGSVGPARVLLESGADVHATDQHGRTPAAPR